MCAQVCFRDEDLGCGVSQGERAREREREKARDRRECVRERESVSERELDAVVRDGDKVHDLLQGCIFRIQGRGLVPHAGSVRAGQDPQPSTLNPKP